MKIRLVVLEKDANYLQKIVSVFNNKFGSELEIYSFTDLASAIKALGEKNADVFLANNNFEVDFSLVPKKCGFAYLVESNDIDKYNNQKAISKFQRAELIYKHILSIYAEQTPNIIGMAEGQSGSTKTIIFSSPCGGAGTSSLAAACAIAFAAKGQKTLYLNLQKFGCADAYFSCDGQFDFSDVIYAIKSSKSNKTIKLQSTVKQDASGVYFYSSVKNPLDMLEFDTNDFIALQKELYAMGEYTHIVADIDFPKVREEFKSFENCSHVVVATDGTNSSDTKLERMMTTVQTIDSNAEFSIQPRFLMIKNKINSARGSFEEIKTIGEFPLYQNTSPMQMAKQLAQTNIFDQLL